MTNRYGVKVFLAGLTLAGLALFGALRAQAAECTDRYFNEPGNLVVDLGGAFYDSVTGDAACLPAQNPNRPAQTVQRPLSDFLDRQATFCFPDGAGGCRIFDAGVPNILRWRDIARNQTSWIDYAGLVPGFGTVLTGSVSETRQKDGRALVRVDLFARDAFTWVGTPRTDGTVLFGNRIDAVQAGAAPALGESHLRIDFYMPTMGAVLPDLIDLTTNGQDGRGVRSLTFTSDSFGELRAASGVADGTAGEAEVTIVLLLQNGIGPEVPVDNLILSVIE